MSTQKHALDLPEISHMLSVLTGAQTALSELLKVARKERDGSVIRLCVAEAETISKTAVRLAQSMSAWEAENPGEVHRNLPPPPHDPELEQMAQEFLDILRPLRDHIREDTISRHAEGLASRQWRESDYTRSRDHVRTPHGDSLSIADWLTILSHFRDLSPAEVADLKNLKEQ